MSHNHPLPDSVDELRRAEQFALGKSGVISEEIIATIPTRQNVKMVQVQGGVLQSFRFDIWDLVQDLLNDEVIARSCSWTFVEQQGENGERKFDELNSGLWWKEMEREAFGARVLAIILYADETTVSLNGRTLHPVYMTLGNIPVSIRYSAPIIVHTWC